MLKKIFICLLFAITAFCFISCEEPDDLVMQYGSSMPKLVGRSTTFIDILWDKTTIKDFKSYDIFYRAFDAEEPTHYISITNKWEVYITIIGLQPNTRYKIFVVTNDKNGNKYTSEELAIMTLSDGPSPVGDFRITSYTDIGFDSYMVSLAWTSYTDFFASAFSHYSIHMKYTEPPFSSLNDFTCTYNNTVEVIIDPNITETSIYISGYSDIRKYYFKLRMYNKLGNYSESQTVLLTTD